MEKSTQTSVMAFKPLERTSWRFVPLLLLLAVAASTTYLSLPFFPAARSSAPEPSFAHLSTHCSPPPIPASSYTTRLSSLAKTLRSQNTTAYILEPSPNAQYYTNVSLSHWGLSERPLLLVISSEGEGKVSVITPAFESTRARLLPIPFEGVEFFEWQEAESPYAVTLRALGEAAQKGEGKVYVDEMMRMFVVQGLRNAAPGLEVEMASQEVKALREKKTEEEREIMRCVNELTLLAIREVRQHLKIGMRESEGRAMMSRALSDAGLTDLDNLFLVGENAALPHGRGTDRVITAEDFILIDCGGSLHGYKSDVTRTFALPDSQIPSDHLELWYSVQRAQLLALRAAQPGAPARSIDSAARTSLHSANLSQYFTHRLGHGIGLEVHESPYLLESNDLPLEVGNTFSDEPGVYITGKVGVRLEDCFEVLEGGGVPLTQRVGGFARTPWDI